MPSRSLTRLASLIALSLSALSLAACCCPVPEGLQSWLEEVGADGLGGAPATTGLSPLAAEALRYFPADEVCDPAYLQRAWCPVSAIGDATFPPPAEASTLLGLTVAIPDDGDRDAFLENATRLAALQVGPNSARLVDITPSNDQESAEVAEAVATIAAALKLGRGAVQVAPGLAAFVDDLAKKEGYPLVPGDHGATWDGASPAQIWRVSGQPFGDAYVVVEDPGQGVYVSVFPIVANERSAAPEGEEAEGEAREPAAEAPAAADKPSASTSSPKPSASPKTGDRSPKDGVKGGKVGKSPRGGKPRMGSN